MVNLHQHITAGSLNTQIALVIASKPCAGIDRARKIGIEPLVIPGVIPAEQLASLLQQHRIDLVVLAGYLKLVNVPAGYEGRIVNIHPALLPAFGGKGMWGHHVHEAVLAHGCKVSGCTVHLVDSRYDTGPILVQRTCEVLPNDTSDTLAARVFEQECIAYPEAIKELLRHLPPR